MAQLPRIAILHYAGPPTIGGVESVIAHHASGLADLGYAVRVIAGSGTVFDSRVDIHIHPLFGSRHPDILAVKQELDTGIVSAAFYDLVARQQQALDAALIDCDVCIVHNVHTMNKNLPLTAALSQRQTPHQIAWCHDLAWTNPQYLPELHEGEPWELLRQAWQNTRYVTISEPRRAELAALLHLPPEQIPVVTGGVDPAAFFRWTVTMQQIEARYHLLDADLRLLLPARLTRRKNIALALKVLQALRSLARLDARLIITGPPGPHNPANAAYLDELLDLRQSLGLADAAHFLYEMSDPPLLVDDSTIACLYQCCDALFFPSTQEGFGIPLLEAGLTALPVFCSDIPPFQQTGGQDVNYFNPVVDAPEAIAACILETLTASPVYRMRRRVLREFQWKAIIQEKLVPLLESLVL